MDSGQQFDVAILGTGFEGQHQNPDEANQFAIPPFREGYEAHLHRQDIDAWLTYTPVHYGAVVKYKTPSSS